MAAAMIEDISRLEGGKAIAHEEACKSTIAVTYTGQSEHMGSSLLLRQWSYHTHTCPRRRNRYCQYAASSPFIDLT